MWRLGLGLITIVGQCVGAGEPEQAKAYTKKVIAVNYGLLLVICTCMAFFRSQMVGIYNLSPEASDLAQKLLLAHSFGMVLWPLAFALPNTLRAGLDARFTMMVSVFSMWMFRIGLGYVFVNGTSHERSGNLVRHVCRLDLPSGGICMEV